MNVLEFNLNAPNDWPDWLSFIYIFLNFYTFLILMLFVRFFFDGPDTSHKLKQIKSNKLGSHATTWIHVLSLQNVLSNQINTNFKVSFLI